MEAKDIVGMNKRLISVILIIKWFFIESLLFVRVKKPTSEDLCLKDEFVLSLETCNFYSFFCLMGQGFHVIPKEAGSLFISQSQVELDKGFFILNTGLGFSLWEKNVI